MRALGIYFILWKFAVVCSDSSLHSPPVNLQDEEIIIEYVQKHKLDPKQMHFDELENQTVLDGLTIHEAETETKLKVELTRLQRRSRWKRCPSCRKKAVVVRSTHTRRRRYNTFLNNKIILLQRTVGKLTLSLKKTKAKIKSYEKWKNSTETRFQKLEALIEQLQTDRDDPIPSLSSDDLSVIRSSNNQAGYPEETASPIAESTHTNSRRKNSKRTTSTNFSMNGNVMTYEDIANAVVRLNFSFPTYRTILYKLQTRVSRFNKYILRRQQNLQRQVSSSTKKNANDIKNIDSKLVDLSDRITSGEFVDSVRNATVDRVLDELEPELSSVLHQSLDDLNATYQGKFRSLNTKVELNKGTILAWSRRQGNLRANNMRMRRNLQKSIDSLRNSTRTKILWQNRRIATVTSSISNLKKDTEDKIDSISNFVIDTRSYVQSLNQSLQDIHRASLKDGSASISFMEGNITKLQSKFDIFQQKQDIFEKQLTTIQLENVMHKNNLSKMEESLSEVSHRLKETCEQANQERETLREELASCCKDSAPPVIIHSQDMGPDSMPNSTYVEQPESLLEAPAKFDESSLATLQLKLENAIEKRIQSKTKAFDGITRELKLVKSDFKILNDSVQTMNSTITSDYVTLNVYQAGRKQLEQSIEATMSQKIEEYHEASQNETARLMNRLLELENTTVISDEILHQIVNSSEILKDQMAKLHFFRAFVFLKLGAARGKNVSQIEAIMDRMRVDIDFNYNTTQLITDYVKSQDSRISLLSNEIQDVMFLSETVEDQRISLEELNYTLTEKQNQMSRLLNNFMGAFDTSNYVVKRLRQDLDFMKKNTSNHFIRTFTNLEYLTQIVKETNVAVEENSDRLDDLNSTLLYFAISYEDPVSEPAGASPEPEQPIYYTESPSYDGDFVEPGLISVDDEIIDGENITDTAPEDFYKYVGEDENDGEASALYEFFTPEPRRYGRSILKAHTDREETPDDDSIEGYNSRTIPPIAGQVAFSVGLTNIYQCCGPVRFNKVFANKGGRYDVSNGKFTADVAGHYVFYVTISKKNSFVHAALIHNDISIISIRMEHSSGGFYGQNQSSNSVVLVMNPGDQVWLQTYSGSLKGFPTPSTTFSGFLLSD